MPEARDRLSRADDVVEMFSPRQRSTGGIDILSDQPEVRSGTPFRWGATQMTETLGPNRVAATSNERARTGTPRSGQWRGRNLYGSPGLVNRQFATPVGSGRRGRGRPVNNSVLPSWYPRRPLRDVTAIVRAIQRRRAQLREIEFDEAESHTTTTDAQLEHGTSVITPSPSIKIAPRPKMLIDIVRDRENGDSDALTPQKKLLNSIDKVEKVVMEELRKMKRTPKARKEERESKVRVLMSMR